jgi:hypothetical protein
MTRKQRCWFDPSVEHDCPEDALRCSVPADEVGDGEPPIPLHIWIAKRNDWARLEGKLFA